MSTKRNKRCSFVGCPSSDESAVTSCTFYSFPKDMDRRIQWLEISGCTEPTTYKYLCELHFDDIYISKNQRRNLLLGTAIPKRKLSSNRNHLMAISDTVAVAQDILVDAEEQVEEHGMKEFIDNDFVELDRRLCADISIDSLDTDDAVVRDSMWKIEIGNGVVEQEVVVIDEMEDEMDVENIMQTEQTIDNSSCDLSGPVQLEHPTTTIQKQAVVIDQPTDAARCVQIASESQTDHQQSSATVPQTTAKPIEMTTFIFNGEEYVQMPKRVYVAERQQLETKLVMYTELIRKFKQQLAGVLIDDEI